MAEADIDSKRRIGSSELWVRPVGVGTWQWGDSRSWGYGRSYGRQDVHEAFAAAIDSGLNFFDTAEIYGNGASERLLGEEVRAAGVPVVIASKFMPSPRRVSPKEVEAAIDASLRRLGLDFIDLYQVHWPFTFFMGSAGLMEALAAAVEKGKIRWVGVSNYGAKRMRKARDRLRLHRVPLVSNQVNYSLVHRAPEATGVLKAARDLDITIIAYSPLGQGLLTGKYAPGAKVEGVRRFSGGFSRKGLERAGPMLAELGQIAEARGKTRSQVALNWLIRDERVIAIPGAKTGGQAKSNAGALGWSISDEEAARLDAASLPWLRKGFLDRIV